MSSIENLINRENTYIHDYLDHCLAWGQWMWINKWMWNINSPASVQKGKNHFGKEIILKFYDLLMSFSLESSDYKLDASRADLQEDLKVE